MCSTLPFYSISLLFSLHQMGCCISKCKPKKTHSLQECCSHVHDKLVISQQPTKITPNMVVSNKISPCPPSPPTSFSSSNISSFTCVTSNTSDSCLSSISSTSSVLSSKDRSFSNEFLWSCVKENPHIIQINSLKEASLGLSASKVQSYKSDSFAKSLGQLPLKQSYTTPQRTTPQKRVRSSSPKSTLTRHKSFRKEPTVDQRWLHSSYSVSSRTLRSPSPSRRFSGDHNNWEFPTSSTPKESCISKRMVGAGKVSNATNSVSVSSYIRKEKCRPANPTPSNTSMGLQVALRNISETCTHRIGSKIDETAVIEALARNESDSTPMEDIDNPLISLDCFIFL